MPPVILPSTPGGAGADDDDPFEIGSVPPQVGDATAS
jgi:hypothetical protein